MHSIADRGFATPLHACRLTSTIEQQRPLEHYEAVAVCSNPLLALIFSTIIILRYPAAWDHAPRTRFARSVSKYSVTSLIWPPSTRKT